MLKRLPLLIAVLTLAGWAGNFTIKNFLAVSLIAYGQPGESSDAAVGYAPANAEVLAARARDLLYRADPPRPDEAIADLRKATIASPRDYRYWLELGKAYNSNGQTQLAETQLQYAVDLAPKYFEPCWALANLQLRAGKVEQSVAQFRTAISLSGGGYGEISPRLNRNVTLNAFNAIVGAVGMNLDVLRRMTPADNAAQAYLAEFLAAHDAMNQALELWRQLPAQGVEADALSYRDLVIQLLRELQSTNHFGEAKEVWIKFASAERVVEDANNLITNPGFELAPLSEKHDGLLDPPSGFDWIMLRHPEVRVGRDGDGARSGAKALHLVFAASMNSAFQQISQLASVDPSRQYRLSYFVKSKNISSLQGELPFIEITDAATPALFTLRSVAPSATTDWNSQALTFTTPENTHGLRLKIHAPQLKTIDSTRIAELWLDDFKLELVK